MKEIEIQNLKNQYRLFLKKQIADLSISERHAKSLDLELNMKTYFKNQIGKIGSFKSLQSEPEIIWTNISQKIEWCKVQVVDNFLKFESELSLLDARNLVSVCIPALGFNVNGARLGRGGGFYDRTLGKFNKNKIGIAYDFSVSENVPYIESQDIKMNVIITDKRIINLAA